MLINIKNIIKKILYIVIILSLFVLYDINKNNIKNKNISFDYFKILISINNNNNNNIKFFCKKIIKNAKKNNIYYNMSKNELKNLLKNKYVYDLK